jgi:hypothetical protein
VNADDRHAIRHAIDQRRRQLVADQPAFIRNIRGCCSGCGADFDTKTYGCKVCIDRHHHRGLRARNPSPPYRDQPRQCSGCGCDHEDRTPGCVPCKKRHFERRKRARLRQAVA